MHVFPDKRLNIYLQVTAIFIIFGLNMVSLSGTSDPRAAELDTTGPALTWSARPGDPD